MRVLIFTDFDQTMIKQNSTIFIAKEMFKFYKKNFGLIHALKLGFRTFYRGLLYFMTKNTKHFYKAFFYFDQTSMQIVAKKLTYNPKWIKTIENIKKQYPKNTKFNLIILSRNIFDLIINFTNINKNKEILESLNLNLKQIIAHTDILYGKEYKTQITAGSLSIGEIYPTVELEKVKNTISNKEFNKLVLVKSIDNKDFKARLAGYISQNKQLYIDSKNVINAHYIGDKEDAYLKSHLSKITHHTI